MGVVFEMTIAPVTPANLSREQFIGLARDLIEEQIFRLPATLIAGPDLGNDALKMSDRADGDRTEPGEILATATNLAALISAIEVAPFGVQDLCIVFADVHPVARGEDPDDYLDDDDDSDASDSDAPAWDSEKPDRPTALVMLFARPAPRMEAFDHGVFDDDGKLVLDEDGEMLENWEERPLQHFAVVCDLDGGSFEEDEQLLAVLKRAYGESLQTDSYWYD